MERKLASIQKVWKIEPIAGADKIELAHVLGWQCVVQKGQFQEGDLGVFIEIDSVLPQLPEFEFMRDKHYHVRTIKLRGQISQGLFMSMSILEGKKYPTDTRDNPVYDISEGKDVAGLVGIVKYEPPLPPQIAGMIYGNFPTFIPKTDEIRLQSEPGLLDEIRGIPVYITDKVDGTSGTFYKKDGHFGVCSRNWEYKDEGNTVYWNVAKKNHIDEALDDGYALQGEVAGPGVNKNTMGLGELDVFMFNLWDINKAEYLPFEVLRTLCNKTGLKTVPVWQYTTIGNMTIEDVIGLARGTYGNGRMREGIVIRPVKEMHSAILGGRLSVKVINNEYLLKGGE